MTDQRESEAVLAALRRIVEQARGDDEWVSGHDLIVRVGAIVLDTLASDEGQP
jgi:hypothetical protein